MLCHRASPYALSLLIPYLFWVRVLLCHQIGLELGLILSQEGCNYCVCPHALLDCCLYKWKQQAATRVDNLS